MCLQEKIDNVDGITQGLHEDVGPMGSLTPSI